MKLNEKLIFSYFGISLLIGSIGVAAMLYLFEIHSGFSKKHQLLDEYSALVASIESELNRSMITLGALVRLDEKDSTSPKSEIPSVGLLKKQLLDQLGIIDSLTDSLHSYADSAHLSGYVDSQVFKTKNKLSLYTELSRQAALLLEQSREEGATLFYTSVEPYFRNQILTTTAKIREQSQDLIIQGNNEIYGQIERSYYWMAALTALVVLFSVIIASRIYASIAQPLTMLNTAAAKLGKGDLDIRCDINGNDEIAELSQSFNSMAKSLKESMYSRNYLRSILESVKEYMIVTDESLRITGCNKATSEILGRTENELDSLLITHFIDIAQLLGTSQGQQWGSRITDLRIPGKDPIPVQLSYSKLKNNLQAGEGFVFVLTDMRYQLMAEHTISKGEQEIETLLSEVHHRVKNNLAVISGILHLQAAYTQDNNAKKVLNESQARIQSMAAIHELLYKSENFSEIGIHEYLPGLIKGLRKQFPIANNIEFKIEAHHCRIALNEAVPFGLLINELILQLINAIGNDGGMTVNLLLESCAPYFEVRIAVYSTEASDQYILTSDSLGGLLVHTLLDQLGAELITGSAHDQSLLELLIRIPCNADKQSEESLEIMELMM